MTTEEIEEKLVTGTPEIISQDDRRTFSFGDTCGVITTSYGKHHFNVEVHFDRSTLTTDERTQLEDYIRDHINQ